MDLAFDTDIRDYYDQQGYFRMRGDKKVYRPTIYSDMVERWVDRELACPHCGRRAIRSRWTYPFSWHDFANYECAECGALYYLIRANHSLRSTIQSSFYKGLLEQIEKGTAPDIICLACDRHEFKVTDLIVIPASSLRPEFLSPGRTDVPQDEDGWCWIQVGLLQHELGDGSVIDLVRDGEIVAGSQA